SGGGDGGSLEGPTTFARALSGSRPGDEIRLLKGSYEGKYRISSGGTAQHPLVIRNNPGDMPKLTGWIQVADGVPSVWIWGLEVTYPTPPAVKGDDCISLQ